MLYNVTEVPAMFLISRDGTIVAKNLFDTGLLDGEVPPAAVGLWHDLKLSESYLPGCSTASILRDGSAAMNSLR